MLPDPLLHGLAIAGVAAVAFAGLFAAGERLFPTRPSRGGVGGSEPRRRAEMRAYLGSLGERYVEDATVAGETVAFHLPDRDVAITFDARAYFRLEGGEVVPVLVEHELPGAGLGARLPFETPRDRNREPTATSGTDPGGAFDVLGVSPDASPEAVREAYRERVKEVHPDQGGSERAFRRVREAYAAARRRATRGR